MNDLRERAQNEATVLALNDLLRDARAEIDELKAEVERVKTLNHSQFGEAIRRNAEVDALRKAITDINGALEREYWSEYAGLEETRAIIDSAMDAGEQP